MPLSCTEIVALWEGARDLSPLDRALALWAATQPGRPLAEFAAASIGRRDQALFALRRALYGPTAECFLECPRCDEPLEFSLDLEAIAGGPPDDGGPGELALGPWTCRYRLPTTEDLHATSALPDGEAVRVALLERCVIELRRAGDLVATRALPSELEVAVEAEMERRDPQADVTLALHCARCEHAWSTTFDIASFLWREIDRDASRLLREVDLLARAYGWSESAILALSRTRRQVYLELMGGA